ncbi:vesicle-associated membrane protein 1 isoform X1 [Strix uralensis]|uniref:vesicle-associated membrane protein 1 isoform X1 n=1 Tax=Strix uralensis TaxID=36305 RepID=UPI003DA735B4
MAAPVSPLLPVPALALPAALPGLSLLRVLPRAGLPPVRGVPGRARGLGAVVGMGTLGFRWIWECVEVLSLERLAGFSLCFPRSDPAPQPAPGAPEGGAPGGGPPGPPPNQSSNRRLQQTQAQVKEVVDIMCVNVDKVLERDQRLSELDDRADALQAGASQFESSAAKLKRKYWWKNCKMMIMMGVICAIVVVVIARIKSFQSA